jgi:hypothetical protein
MNNGVVPSMQILHTDNTFDFFLSAVLPNVALISIDNSDIDVRQGNYNIYE